MFRAGARDDVRGPLRGLPVAVLAAVLAVRAVWVVARATANNIKVPARSETRLRYHRHASLGVAFVLAAQFVLFQVWHWLAPAMDGPSNPVMFGLLPQLLVLGAGAWLAWSVSSPGQDDGVPADSAASERP